MSDHYRMSDHSRMNEHPMQPRAGEHTEALWGGRFTQSISEVAHRFSSSIALDGELYREDITGSIAHARMLGKTGIIEASEANLIIEGLLNIRQEIESGSFEFNSTMEDVHLAIERRLIESIGAVGGKLHTGRSRNDQVALDERLYLRSAIDSIIARCTSLMLALVEKADELGDAIMPGYTHMQRAQPILIGHHLLAYVEMLSRDLERLTECRSRVNRSPLGSAAFAGTSYPLDREMTAKELGFDQVSQNSIDAVSDRDHLIEFASAASIVMMHLSRMAEEFVIWSTTEFGFVMMSDAVTTGSSIMPQKKNPDMAELIRGKVGRVYGALINLLTTMKALPLAYNRDMQEDKEPMFAAVRTTSDCLEMMAVLVRETEFQKERLSGETSTDDRSSADDQRSAEHPTSTPDLSTATEIADYLARKNVPFREAHHITGRIVAFAVQTGVRLREIPLARYQSFSPLIAPDIYQAISATGSVRAKQTIGSTNPLFLEERILFWRNRLVERERTN